MATATLPIPSYQDYLIPQDQAAPLPDYADYLVGATPQPPPPSGFLRRAADFPVGVIKGVVDIPGVAVGLADIPTGGATGKATAAILDTLATSADAFGLPKWARPSQWSAQLGDLYTPETKAAVQAQSEETRTAVEAATVEGAGPVGQILAGAKGTATGLFHHPGALVPLISENLPQMFVISKATSILLKPLQVGLNAEIAAGTKTDVEADRILGAAAIKFSTAGEGVMAAGQVSQGITQANPDADPASRLAAAVAGFFTGAIARGVSNIPGLGNVEASVATALLGKKTGFAGSLAERVGKGILSEGILQEPLQSGQEQIWQNIGSGRPWQEGVGEQIVQGSAAGIGLGAGGAALAGMPVISRPLPPPPGAGGPPPPDENIPAAVGVGNPAMLADDAIKAANKAVDSPKIVTAAALDAAIEGVKPEVTAPSVAALHRLAEAKGIPWDNDPTFMALTESVTGKQHLDELTPEERAAVAVRLAQEPSRTPTVAPGAETGLIAPVAPVSVQPEAEEPGIYDVPRHELPTEDSQRLLDKAQVARGLVAQGEAGKRYPVRDDEGAITHWTGSASTYPDFYGPLRTSKKAVLSALERIIEDAGKDTGPLVARVKKAIDQSSDVEGMVGAALGAQPETGQPAHPATDYGVFTDQELGDVVARLKRTMDALPKDRRHVIEAELEQIRLLQQQRQEQPPTGEVPTKTEAQPEITPPEAVKAEMPQAPTAPEAPAPPSGELFAGSETMQVGAAPIIGHDVNPVTAETEAPLFSKAAQEEQPEQGTLPETTPGPGDTKVKETLKAKREEPLPGRSLQIGRGAHGQVKVVFPSKILADLFSFTGRMKRSIEGGKKFDVRANGEYLRKQLGLSDTANVGSIAQDYKAVVMAAIKTLKEGETFTAPDYTERTTQDAQAARDAEDAKTAAIQAEKEKLKKKKVEKPDETGTPTSEKPAMTDKEKADILTHGGRGAILPNVEPEKPTEKPVEPAKAEPEPESKDEIIRSAAAVKFTASQKDELQKRLKEKLRAAKSGGTVAEEPAPYGKPAFDARFLADTMQYGAIYLNEDGKTTFADWGRQMVADLGEDVKPYLRATWSALQALPGNLTIRPNIAASLFEYGVKLYDSTPDKTEFMAKLTKPFGAMSKPYAESVWAGLTAMASPVSEPALKSEDPGLTISDGVLAALEDYRVNGKPLTREALFAMADQAYAGTQGEGAYTPKDAFDALELGVNRYIAKKQGTMFYNPALQQNVNPDIGAQTIIDRIRKRIMDAIPSQAGLRTDEMLEFQQFSTPPDLAFAMNWVANLNSKDVVLEPSAGVGGIAVFAKLTGARVVVNELSDRRAALVKHLGFDRVMTENAEQIANLYPDDEARPTVVIMNPPFSSTAGRMGGDRKSLNVLRHIEQAFSLLPEGGRLVVLIGDHNLGRDTSTSLHGPTSLSEGVIKGLAAIPGQLQASIRISGEGYKKYGTTYGNRLLVYDKIKPTGMAPVVESVADIKDALDALAEVRHGRAHPTAASLSSEQPAAQPGGETLAGEGQPGTRPELPVPVPTAPVGPQRSGADLSQEGVGGNVPTVPGGAGVPGGPGGGVSLPHRGGRRGTGGGRPATTGQPTGGGGVAPGSVPVTNDSGRESDTEFPAERESGRIDLELGGGERTKHAGDLTDNLYEDYTPQKLKIEGAKPHPAKLVESAAMAATELPDPTYVPNLPQSIIEKGLLSLPQLEPIVYAGQAHAVILPNGERQGIALGYGTGFGKGRVISGIILDNFRQGRSKAIWLSEKHNLVKSAVRDWTDIGQSKDVFVPGDSDANKPLARRKGDSILFTTYSTLRQGSGIDVQGHVSIRPEMVKGQPTGQMEPSRLEQLITWAGPDFDGVIALDEAHNLANTEGAEGERGKAAGSLQAAVGVELKRRLPKARVVYVSATAAKGVDTIVYMERLGLWGQGTPFPKKSDFIANMQLGGLGSMEVIARDLKADGKYLSVSLDNSQVTYEQLEHELDRKQTDNYNELAKAWQIVLQNIEAAMAETGITGTTPDGSTRTNNGTAKGRIIGRLWSAEQRFFNQVLTSLSMPTTIAKMKQAIADGHSPVVYLVNTYEASMKRQLAKIAKEGGSYEDVDMTPREDLMEYIRKGFPVQQFEEYRDDKNVIKSRPVTDSQGNPVLNRAAVKMRDELLEKIGSMNIFPDSPIDQMLNALGHDNVAEVTGRKSRLKRVGNTQEQQPRSRTIANAEIEQFNNDQRRSLIFNDFGGTGESYDSDKRIKNQRRRVLFIVQPGWQATKVIQALGRVHRSNEANAPHIVLTMTNVRGHRRFISTVARGLDAIGAITKGQRETGSTGLIDAKNNLQNIYGRAAVTSFMEDLVRGQVKDLNDQQGILARMGLAGIVDRMTGGIAETKMPTIEKFLNRIMSLEIFEQNQVFDEFYARMTHFVEDAAAKGMLDVGMETYRANGGIKLVDEQVAHVDEHSGAKTYWETFEAKHSVSFLPFDQAAKGRGSKPFLGFYQNRQSGKMWAVSESFMHTLENGTIQQMILLQGPVVGQVQHIPQESILPNGSYSKVEPDIAEAWWKATIAAHPEHRTETLHMVSGALLKIWDRLPVTHARIMRLQTETGERYLGRIILNADVKETKQKLGVGAAPITATPAQIAVKVQTEGAKVTLANGWKIKAAHLQNETRIELTGNELYAHREEIKKAGGFWEVRGSTTRYFLPIGEKAPSAIEAITKNHPVVDIQEKGDDTILQEEQARYGNIPPMATDRGPGSPENAQQPPEPGREADKLSVEYRQRWDRANKSQLDREMQRIESLADNEGIIAQDLLIQHNYLEDVMERKYGAKTPDSVFAAIAEYAEIGNQKTEVGYVLYLKNGEIISRSEKIVGDEKHIENVIEANQVPDEVDSILIIHNHPRGSAIVSIQDAMMNQSIADETGKLSFIVAITADRFSIAASHGSQHVGFVKDNLPLPNPSGPQQGGPSALREPTAPYDLPPDAQAQVAALNREVERREGIADAFRLATPTDEQRGVRDAFKKVFNVTIVPVTLNNPDATTLPLSMQYRDHLFVNADNPHHGFVQLAGHELLHHLRQEAPKLYSWLAQEAGDYLSADAEARYRGRLEAAGETPGEHRVEVREEILADFTGDALADPAFLQMLAKHNPGKFQLLLRSVIRWLKQVDNKLSTAGFGSSEYITDVQEMQERLAAVLDLFRSGGPKAISTLAEPTAPYAPIFYSKAERTITEKMANKAEASAVKKMLENNGVKADEQKWSGLDDYLAGKKILSKADVLDFIKANEVQVQAVVLGGADKGEAVLTRDFDGQSGYVWVSDGEPVSERFLTSNEAEKNPPAGYTLRAFGGGSINQPGQAKFSSYTIPGGTAYREILLTLPVKPADDFKTWLTKRGIKQEDIPPDADWRSLRDQFESEATLFRSSHFPDTPNVLAHARVDDRVDADGRRVLFLEELQSDWAAKGRREGFNSLSPTEQKRWKELDHIASQERVLTPQEQAEYDALDKRYGREGKPGIPVAPFVTKAEAWMGLVLKRLLRLAAEEGYDRIAWTPGSVQADRYDLSKQIDSLQWDTGYGPDVTRIVALKNDEEVISRKVPDAELDTVVGKDLAKKILDAKARDEKGGEYSGLDLKVGGAWAFRLYDEMIPQYLAKYAKKWGSSVSRIELRNIEPKSIGKISEDFLGAEEAARSPLNIVDALVVSGLHYDQILAAVVEAIPVNVVDTLTAHGINPNEFARKPKMFSDLLPVNSHIAVSDGLRNALSKVGARLRAGLDSAYEAGLDSEILPALRASDIDTNVASRILFPESFSVRHGRDLTDIGVSPRGTGLGTEASTQSVARKDTAAELARFENWHENMIAQRGGDVKSRTLWALTITPAMAKSVLTDGQSLFEAQQPYTVREGENPNVNRQLSLVALGQIDRAVDAVQSVTGSDRPGPGAVPGGPVPARGVPPPGAGGIRELALAVPRQLARDAWVDLRGTPGSTHADLAAAAEVSRNPYVETFVHYAIGPDGGILGAVKVGSRAAGSTLPFVRRKVGSGGIISIDWKREVLELRLWLEKLGATGYAFSHNHPSGISTPSQADIDVTYRLVEDLDVSRLKAGKEPLRFLGHVVRNGGEYHVLEMTASGLQVSKHEFSGRDFMAEPASPHLWLNKNVNSSMVVAEVAKSLGLPSNEVTLIASSGGRIRGLYAVPIGLMLEKHAAGDVLRGLSSRIGAHDFFTYYTGPSARTDQLARTAADLVRVGVLRDHLMGPYLSLHDQGGHTVNYEWRLGRPINTQKGYRVGEEEASYTRGGEHLGDLTEAQEAALRHVHGEPQTWRTKLNAFKANWKQTLVQGLFDQYAPILNYSNQAYVLARMTKGGEATLEALLLYGKPYVDQNGAYRVDYHKETGLQGFAKVLAGLHGEHDRFLEWVAAQRAGRLTSIGLEHLYRNTDIAALKTLNQGTMKDGTPRKAAYAHTLLQLNEWNHAMVKIAVDSKLVDPNVAQLYRDTPYVPFYRLHEEGVIPGFGMRAGLVNQYAWKKLKGGTEHLNEDLLANLLQNWSHLLTASAKNRAAKATLEAAKAVGVAHEVSLGTPGKGLVGFRDDVTRAIPQGQEYDEGGVAKVSDGTAQITFNAERVFMVDDPALLDAVAALHYAGLGAIGRPFAKMKHWLTFGVTVSPAFKIRNLLRDSIQAIGTAPLSYNPAKNIAQGFAATALESETRAQLLAAGGMVRFGSMLDGNNADRTRRLIEQQVDPDTILDDANKVTRFWKERVLPVFEAYQEFGDRGEQISRAALYEQLLAKGVSHQEAAFWARDLLDFGLMGKWEAVRILAQTVPFMNARLQGIYKLGRATKADYKRMGATLGAVALASIALLLAYHDDDDWKKREDWDRDNYWWFKIGGLAFRLPKPFEVGAVGTLAERSVEYVISHEMTGRRLRDRLSATIFNQLNMNPTPQLVKPLMDIYANKDAFTGRPIETMGMERLRKEDRATARTSEVAKALGALGLPDPTQLAMGQWNTLSPVQIDALARGYFGWLGATTMTALDYGIRPMMNRDERPNLRLRDVFLAGSFTETLPAGSSRYVTDLYAQAAEIEQAYGSYRDALRRGESERARQILQEERTKITLYPMVEALKRNESALTARIKQIESSRTLSGADKRAQIDRLEQRKHEMAKLFAMRQTRLAASLP